VVPVAREPDGRRRVLGLWGWDSTADPSRRPALVPLVDVDGRSVRAGRHAHAPPA